MSQSSTHLSLPYIQGGQAQKHITHNEAIRALDLVVQLSVKDQVTEPVFTPSEGDRYVVSAGATGVFAGQDGAVAVYENGAWVFIAPGTGWVAYEEASGGQIGFDGSTWLSLGTGSGSVTFTDRLGINTSADSVNRLSAAAEATLLTHDGAGHQLKINKALASDTASLLFQTGWSGRAEMGTTGDDDFTIKVSPDGNSFHTALSVDRESGAVSLPNTSLALPEFGAAPLVTRDYVLSRAAGLVTNGTGALGNAYNYPSSFTFDPMQTPDLPGAFYKAGHYSGAEEMTEFVALDPNRVHRLGVYLRQESAPGDWSSYAEGDRHMHYMGFRCYDVDGLGINASHHMRYRHGGLDSLTTLTAPLAPGDTEIQVADASGWNESSTSSYERGLVIFGYHNSLGQTYDLYSRIEEIDLFDLGGVDKGLNEITLNQPLPAALGNPNDPSGIWPIGTKIANRGSGWNYKFGFFNDFVTTQSDSWVRIENAMGGIDRSGRNIAHNFPPGTAQVRPVWLLNYSNRLGGYAGYPDTGPSQRVWVTGVSVEADPMGQVVTEPDGSCSLLVIQGDTQNGTVSLQNAAMTVTSFDT